MDELEEFFADIKKVESETLESEVTIVPPSELKEQIEKLQQQQQQQVEQKNEGTTPPPPQSNFLKPYSMPINSLKLQLPPPPGTRINSLINPPPPMSAPPASIISAPPVVRPNLALNMMLGGMQIPLAMQTRPAVQSAKGKAFFREGAGKVWEDPTLDEWPEEDFRIFVGNLGNDVNMDTLSKAFASYASFQKAKVVRDKKSNKTRGYGFVSFSDSQDMIKALSEMNGKYIGNRPVMLKASKWKDRAAEPTVAKKTMRDAKATGWEQKRKRRYHVQADAHTTPAARDR
eukprot:NODE_1181_length_1056_cov_240.495531_g904_i0.p1 GENE.NODE_1181_length_1056_cov_240.495531_g904_i0~~NODE_1181_length_1056_cov_240.495531_g904_i0.p1  ORF type:complete len:288 (-),score=55.78 NODE_1181_length_1056_cov_240.495531_g904_i0:104-967(-)